MSSLGLRTSEGGICFSPRLSCLCLHACELNVSLSPCSRSLRLRLRHSLRQRSLRHSADARLKRGPGHLCLRLLHHFCRQLLCSPDGLVGMRLCLSDLCLLLSQRHLSSLFCPFLCFPPGLGLCCSLGHCSLCICLRNCYCTLQLCQRRLQLLYCSGPSLSAHLCSHCICFGLQQCIRLPRLSLCLCLGSCLGGSGICHCLSCLLCFCFRLGPRFSLCLCCCGRCLCLGQGALTPCQLPLELRQLLQGRRQVAIALVQALFQRSHITLCSSAWGAPLLAGLACLFLAPGVGSGQTQTLKLNRCCFLGGLLLRKLGSGLHRALARLLCVCLRHFSAPLGLHQLGL
mmetsp:Transcript_6589/g.17670  ORF Transcript_6589/g.17670 Transcript_6589/m.17670 type:complete len:344 (-) Transcript_6589:898-1929(-)